MFVHGTVYPEIRLLIDKKSTRYAFFSILFSTREVRCGLVHVTPAWVAQSVSGHFPYAPDSSDVVQSC